jgi:hypothetical protein
MALTAIRKPRTEEGAFFPQWNCFCCGDTGWIPPHLVRMYPGYEEYNVEHHKNVTCPCGKRRGMGIDSALDNSFTEDQRRHLHQMIHQDWIETNKAIAKGTIGNEMKEAVNAFISGGVKTL